VRAGEQGELERHGIFIGYHPNGRIAVHGYYRQDAPAGVWTWYDPDGNPIRRIARSPHIEEPLDPGEILDPETRFRDPTGVVQAKGQLKFDKPHGEWTYFHEDGNPKAIGSFVTGIPHGRWLYLFPNGQMQRIEHYRLGILDGDYRRGYDNGQEAEQGRLDQGLKEGVWRTWHENGQLQSVGRYVQDLREGEWRYYDEAGRPLRRERYRRDQLAQVLPPLPEELAREPRVYTPRDPLPPTIYDQGGNPIHRPGTEPEPPEGVRRRAKTLR
jgi:antitoxin component YwqK of YwqJK toxin-antitoxin module